MVKAAGSAAAAAMLLVSGATATPGPVRTSLGVSVVFRTDWVPRYRTADVYAIPTGGGRLRTLTRNDVNDFDPAWSADGRRIVFASRRTGNTELHVMNADGSSVRRLTHTQSREVKPAWSPDGRQIAFVGDQNGRDQIYVMSPNGSARRRVTNLEQCASDPSWARDGSRIFGTAGACSDVSLPFSVRPDGSQLAFIRTQPPGDQSDADPALSPNGSRLAFTRIVWQLNTTEVWIARADGSDARRVARDGSLPAWSPDGRRLAFVHGPKLTGDQNGYSFVGGPKVAVMNASGSGLKHLTAEPTYVYGGVGPFHGWRWSQAGVRILGLNWAPDGRSLIYGHRFEMRQPDIAIRAAGAKNLPRRLTANRVIEAQPALSPDGRQIAFLRFSRAGGYPRLYVMQVDGRHQRRVASAAWGPIWSPEGTWIAYDGRDGIRIVRSSGRGDQLLVRETRRTSVLRPVWLSDGLHIAFVRASRTGRSAIWTATVHGGRLDRVGPVPRYLDDFDVAPDGQRLVFSGGRRLFVMNIDGTGRRPFGRREKWGIATPAWCRDGRTIVFASRRDRDWDLYAMTTSGRVFAKVTDNLGDDYEPDC